MQLVVAALAVGLAGAWAGTVGGRGDAGGVGEFGEESALLAQGEDELRRGRRGLGADERRGVARGVVESEDDEPCGGEGRPAERS